MLVLLALAGVIYAIIGCGAGLIMFNEDILPHKKWYKTTVAVVLCGPIFWVVVGAIALFLLITYWLND